MRFTSELASEFSNTSGVLGVHRDKCMEKFAAICDMAKKTELTKQDLVDWRRLAAEHMFPFASAGFAAKPTRGKLRSSEDFLGLL